MLEAVKIKIKLFDIVGLVWFWYYYDFFLI